MDLESAIADHERRGYRLDMIMPADNPRIAVVSKGSEMLQLTATESGVQTEPFTGLGHPVIPPSTQEFVITRTADAGAWSNGRAGMQYRDLIPGRLGGRYIASHIRIPDGGPVNDYVHHHRVRFQMIFVRKGWVRVVYEDTGPPFVMNENDCVLQPPGIRHRVLEASKGLEVIEIGSPAEHETFRDHSIELPTSMFHLNRKYGDQYFVHHEAATAAWRATEGVMIKETDIAAATSGLASVRVLHITGALQRSHKGDFLFLYVLQGRVQLTCTSLSPQTLEADVCCTLPDGANYVLKGTVGCEVLEVTLPAR
jgi:mannose-6-phosphate isomerase-like protein (cupin superfamily)